MKRFDGTPCRYATSVMSDDKSVEATIHPRAGDRKMGEEDGARKTGTQLFFGPCVTANWGDRCNFVAMRCIGLTGCRPGPVRSPRRAGVPAAAPASRTTSGPSRLAAVMLGLGDGHDVGPAASPVPEPPRRLAENPPSPHGEQLPSLFVAASVPAVSAAAAVLPS
jgi:hypothetical protein